MTSKLESMPVKGWFSLSGASEYSSLSVRSLRKHIGDPEHPLPVRRVGGKWLISREELDAWLSGFPRADADLDRLVNDIMEGLH